MNMVQTKEFMLLFRFEPSNNYQPTAEEINAMQQQWSAFISHIAFQEKLISTHQLGFEGMQISSDKSVQEGICIANNLTLAGNMVLLASSIEEATEIAKNCPILFMGGTVEVRNIQPM